MIAQLKYAIRVKRVFQLHLDFMTWAYEIINALFYLNQLMSRSFQYTLVLMSLKNEKNIHCFK